jgi:hypothetical protein
VSRAHRGDVAPPSDGIRPTSAFVLTGCVLLAVAGSAFRMAFLEAGEQPDTTTVVEAPWPEYRIVDRHGEVLAMSVESFDVTASPRSLWRAHTPRRIADAVATRLDRERDDVLLDLLPHEARGAGGWLEPELPELVRFDAAQRDRALDWIDGRDAPAALDGIEIVRLPELDEGTLAADGAGWTLRWRPDLLLDVELRAAHLGEDRKDRPDVWTRGLLRDLGEVLGLIVAVGLVVLDRLPGHLASCAPC